ncbi:MAG: T9SS type A sorting domain-containing protein [Candidatus Kapabacteria bacterium]|nr:T9SS type A sorting domain-containing protein [Candidatus Kapabacteria bacterium]
MAFRLISIIIFLVTLTVTLQSQEKVDYYVDDNLLSVKIYDLNANCCSGFITDYHINYSSGIITITITDTTVQKCRCNCNFDMSVNIGPLQQGKYTVNVFREDFMKYGYPRDKKMFLGRKEVSVYDPSPKSPLTMDFRQSTCKNTSLNPADDEVIRGGIEIFPNPAAGAVSLKFNLKDNSDVSIKILNFLGKEIDNYKFKNLKSGTNLLHLNITELQPGIYIGKLFSSTGQSLTFKLMWSK